MAPFGHLQDSSISSMHSFSQEILFEGSVAGDIVLERFVPVCREGTRTEGRLVSTVEARGEVVFTEQ